MQAFSKYFDPAGHGTTPRRDLLADATTFLTMAYIIFVIPSIKLLSGRHAEAGPAILILALAFASKFSLL